MITIISKYISLLPILIAVLLRKKRRLRPLELLAALHAANSFICDHLFNITNFYFYSTGHLVIFYTIIFSLLTGYHIMVSDLQAKKTWITLYSSIIVSMFFSMVFINSSKYPAFYILVPYLFCLVLSFNYFGNVFRNHPIKIFNFKPLFYIAFLFNCLPSMAILSTTFYTEVIGNGFGQLWVIQCVVNIGFHLLLAMALFQSLKQEKEGATLASV